MLFIAGGYISLYGISFGGYASGGRYAKLYYNYLYFSAFIAMTCPFLVVLSIFHLFHHFAGIIKRNEVNKKLQQSANDVPGEL